MKTTAYGERDYTFGQVMLTLRTKIGLTQKGLANKLGVSRRAVGEWETGGSYPKAEHLKEVIALGVKHQAWPCGRETEEIRALWKAAHQKVLLDELWLSSLLSQQSSSHLHLVKKNPESGLVQPLPVPVPRADWSDALAIPVFHGREEELSKLSAWITEEHCRVVSILGMGGTGKSALAASFMYQQASHFETIIFRSLDTVPAFEALLDDCLQVLSPQSLGTQPVSLEERISDLVSLLRRTRVLLVLDNLECLLETGDSRGKFRPGFLGYGQLLRRVAETSHQSCLLFTSREKPADLRLFSGKHTPVRSLRLSGLGITACQHLLREREVIGTEADQECLINRYGGNPLALKVVAEMIVDLFRGEMRAFLDTETVVFGAITDLLSEQFIRLSALEKTVLYWLAIVREEVSLDELLSLLVTPLPRIQVLESIDSLHRRSLIEPGKRPGSFALQSVMLEYVIEVLITEGSREIQQNQLDRLREYRLEQVQGSEYLRKTQEQLLIRPLLALLLSAYQTRDEIEEQLLALLDSLRGKADKVVGYGPANVITLLRISRGNLNGLDLSRLCIRSACLQGIEMQDINLAETLIR